MNKTTKIILYLVAAVNSKIDKKKILTYLIALATVAYLGAPLTYAAQATSCQPDTLAPVKYRQSGAAVRNLQACLIQAGYSIPAGVTGYYGSQTVNAVKKFYADWYGVWPGLSIGSQGIAHLKQVITKAPKATTTKEPQQTTSTTKGPIKIGFIGAMSGPFTKYGAFEAVNLAVEEINKAGGINGRKIILVAEDGKCDGKEAVNAVNKLINIDKIKIILGGHCTPESLAIAPIVEQNKVIMLASITTSPGLTHAGDYVFRTSPVSTVQSEIIAGRRSGCF